MSAVSERALDLFFIAGLSDDDFGYPDDVTFVPGDQHWSDEVVWTCLVRQKATVLVGECSELLLIPRQRRVIDHLRKRVTVRVEFRKAWQFRHFKPAWAPPSARNTRAVLSVDNAILSSLLPAVRPRPHWRGIFFVGSVLIRVAAFID